MKESISEPDSLDPVGPGRASLRTADSFDRSHKRVCNEKRAHLLLQTPDAPNARTVFLCRLILISFLVSERTIAKHRCGICMFTDKVKESTETMQL